MKRILTLCVLMAIIVIMPVSAISPIDFEADSPISAQESGGGMITRGTSIPTNTWNFEISGKCSISGISTTGTDLYTEYRFAGAPSGIYEISLTNNHSSYKLNVQACRASDGKVLDTYKVAVGETGSFVLGTTSVWYLKILGSSDFSGYVDG